MIEYSYLVGVERAGHQMLDAAVTMIRAADHPGD
jgi:hypothetical protein